MIAKVGSSLFAFLLALLLFPLSIFAAEVLQIRSSSLLQVGDNNRTYTVKIACLEVDPGEETEAITWLRRELPRRRKVNLRPEGVIEGTLLSRVIPFGSNSDLSQALEAAGLGRQTCSPQAIS